MQRPMGGAEGDFLGNPSVFDSFLAEHTLPPYLSGKGVLFRQCVEQVHVISDMDQPIEFDAIEGRESRTRGELVAQAYEMQCRIQDQLEPFAESAEVLRRYRKDMKIMSDLNKRVSRYLREEARKGRSSP
jgi:hypothetical protein